MNIDFSAIKDFRIAERQALQFRMEMFNAPNHVEWGSPSASWGSSNVAPPTSFGQIRGTAASMRQIQFALKYNFCETYRRARDSYFVYSGKFEVEDSLPVGGFVEAVQVERGAGCRTVWK